jgi:hypothetical protein
MAEVLIQFDNAVTDDAGHSYVANVCGRQADDGMWEGWIEFARRDDGVVLPTPRETKQPNRADLQYWARGLTAAYLEGALERALDPKTPDLRPRTVEAAPAYEGPADATAAGAAVRAPIRQHSVLDPFAVYAQGEDLLRDELGALDEGHLRNIVRAHGLVPEESIDLQAVHRPALVDMIVAAVRKRVT